MGDDSVPHRTLVHLLFDFFIALDTRAGRTPEALAISCLRMPECLQSSILQRVSLYEVEGLVGLLQVASCGRESPQLLEHAGLLMIVSLGIGIIIGFHLQLRIILHSKREHL